MSKRYKNPPIIEAICEFQFDPSSSWDLTVPGLLYNELRQNFPVRRERRILTQNVSETPEGPRQNITWMERMQFYNKEETALVQISPHLISINHLKPYPSWTAFLPLIERGLDAYRKIASPSQLRRVGLRYINRIELPGSRAELEDYFEFLPHLGKNLPKDYVECIVGIVIPFKDPGGLLKLQLTRATLTPDMLPMVLDLDHFAIESDGMALDNAMGWVNRAHKNIEDTFEACITDRTRELFDRIIG